MKVSVLQVDRSKPILGLNTFYHAPVCQHLERELVQSPVQDSEIQDWPKDNEASSPNSLGPKRDWPEVRGEEYCPQTVLSWLLAKWDVGESEEAGRRTLSSHGPEKPEEKEIALSLRRWVPVALGPAAKQKILLLALHRGKERRSSRRLPRQGRFVDFLDNLGPGWDSGGAALLREARRAGLCVD